MDKRLDFQFSVQRPPEGPLVEMSAEEMERTLLKRLEAEKSAPTDALWQLARFYQQSKQPEKGLACLRQTLAHMPDVEAKAHCVLGMGQMMEAVQDYEAAVRYYREALALEPVHTDTWYFINNNLGFSLNTLGQFADGENYCRKAIEINPNRPNAFKNLGIALKAQGEYREAARCFVTSTQVNAADARSFHLLQEMLREHPELEYEFQGDVECCKKAVEVAVRRLNEHVGTGILETCEDGGYPVPILLIAVLKVDTKAVVNGGGKQLLHNRRKTVVIHGGYFDFSKPQIGKREEVVGEGLNRSDEVRVV